MKLRTTKYFAKEGFKNLKRNKVMSLASITSVIAALLVIGIFFIIMLNIDYAASALESQIEMMVYLDEGLSEDTIGIMASEMKSINGVKDVLFVSKDLALKNMESKLGDNGYLLEGLEGDNPLPDTFIVTLVNPQNASSVSLTLSSMSNITNVSYGKEDLEKLLKATYVLRMGSLFVIIILLFISIFIIANTIKLTVFARRREIGIMKFVGATDWFVRGPFVIEGMILGVLGGIVATSLLSGGYYYCMNLVRNQMIGLLSISLMPFRQVTVTMSVLLLCIGLIIGALGSLLSVRRFIKV